MKLHSNKDFNDKKTLLQNIETQDSVIQSLFFCARNGAIANILYEIENHFSNLGFNVKAEWEESSFSPPYINIILFDKKQEQHRRCWLDRSKEGAWDSNNSSTIMYKLKSIDSTTYSPYKISVHTLNFQSELASQSFFDLVNNLVHATNYPFGNSVMSYEDKVKELQQLENCNNLSYLAELFEVARKYSVITMLRDIKSMFRGNGFKVALSQPDLTAETSFITVSLAKPQASFDIEIKREDITDVSCVISSCMYSFVRVCNMTIPKSKAKLVNDFQVYTLVDPFDQNMSVLVNGLNYPFNYDSHSSF